MTPVSQALRGLWRHRRAHLATALGIATATAVLVGALVVGDTVRSSLRGLTLERLGRITHAVTPGRPLRAALADELRALPGFAEHAAGAAPLWLDRGSLAARIDGENRRASRVNVVGCDDSFWRLGDDPRAEPNANGAWLTERVAAELGVKPGDYVVLRLAAWGAIPADSPLGEKVDTVASLRIKVAGVLPARGLARFGLEPSQGAARTLFAPLAAIQRAVGKPQHANTLVVAAKPGADGWLAENLRPTLADLGLTLDQPRAGVWQLEAESLVLPDGVSSAAREAWEGDAGVVTYLANTIRVGDRSIPYSTVVGVESLADFAPGEQPLGAGDVALNRWAADDLAAKVGDEVTLTYYEPESTHGVLAEGPPLRLRLAAIVELAGANGDPTTAADPRLAPRLPGVTDADSIADWDLPFDLLEPVRDEDEVYWEDRKTTPKAFVAHTLAKRLWGTRWGSESIVRVAGDASMGPELKRRLLDKLDAASLGFVATNVRQRDLAASAGSTPFDVLFLLFSMFLLASAALLVLLLVSLAVDARRSEIGLLSAVGFDKRGVRKWLLREQLGVALVGTAAGLVAGIAYAALLVWLLQTVWIDAIVEPFLRLRIGWAPLAIAAVGAMAIAHVTAYRGVGAATREPPRGLLAEGASSVGAAKGALRRSPRAWLAAAACLALAVAAAAWGSTQRGDAAAGGFFGAGAATLASGLLAARTLLRGAARSIPRSLSLLGLAMKNVARNAGRSLLTVALVAAASFLVLATSAFHLAPTGEGTGGYELVATLDQPLHFDPGTPEGRLELGFDDRDEGVIASATVVSLRARPGEDASCRNLYQARQPRVLGVTRPFVERGGFAWAEVDPAHADAPWRVLAKDADSTQGEPIPAVLDFNTAVYAMKLYGGVGSTFTVRDEAGRDTPLVVAGLLKNSLLQGVVLVGERDFLRLFPGAGGHGELLVDSADADRVGAILEERLADYGADAEPTLDRLAGFLAVQNTYLSTFQALGGLGLLLGGLGLGVAQLRSFAERRGELALLRATGYPLARLRRLLLAENLLLLGGGLALGGIAAAVALAPSLAAAGASAPWGVALCLVTATLVLGVVAGRFAGGAALAAPITPALRGR
ncbi:MAG: FtsX-like permease family protein [Lacipirellulaceae bacterium]